MAHYLRPLGRLVMRVAALPVFILMALGAMLLAMVRLFRS
jgi:hypothetical protein